MMIDIPRLLHACSTSNIVNDVCRPVVSNEISISNRIIHRGIMHIINLWSVKTVRGGMSKQQQNVFYVGVARIAAGKGVVVGSYSFKGADVDNSGVRSVLEQPTLNLAAGKHYSFAVGQAAWHLIQGNLSFFPQLIRILSCD